MKTDLERRACADMARITGWTHHIDLSAMDEASLREFIRFLRHVEEDKIRAVQQARLTPRKG